MLTSISRIAFSAADASTGPSTAPNTAPVSAPAADKPAKAKRNAKPSKSAKPATGKPSKRAKADTTEAEPDKRTAKAERVAAERSDVAAFYAGFEQNRASVPVKPLSAFKPLATFAHTIDRNPSHRQAAAICAALAGAGVKLVDGAKAPRVFEHNGVRVCVENGVLRDAVSSGLVTVTGGSPETETITVRAKQANAIAGFIGAKLLKAAKLA